MKTVSKILGTKFFMSGSAGRWMVWEGKPDIGDSPVAGPFKTRKLAIEWAIKYRQKY